MSLSATLEEFGSVETRNGVHVLIIETNGRVGTGELDKLCNEVEQRAVCHVAGGTVYDDCVCLDVYESEVKR